jgi:hypothetical protein
MKFRKVEEVEEVPDVEGGMQVVKEMSEAGDFELVCCLFKDGREVDDSLYMVPVDVQFTLRRTGSTSQREVNLSRIKLLAFEESLHPSATKVDLEDASNDLQSATSDRPGASKACCSPTPVKVTDP